MTPAELAPTVIDNLTELIELKEAELRAGGSATNQYKLKFYKQWLGVMQGITAWPATLDELKTVLKFQDGLVKRFREVAEKGQLEELSVAATTPLAGPMVQLPGPAATAVATDPGKPITIESVPKQLSGDRPTDVRGGRIYDLQLLHGFGTVNATEYVDAGCTLEQLLKDWADYMRSPHGGVISDDLRSQMPGPWLPKLKHDQLVGLKYFYDVAEKIPREEIAVIERYCRIVANSLYPGMILNCCGSYRRGKDRCGDVDCLMAHPDLKTMADVEAFEADNGHIITAMVQVLKELGFIVDAFACGDTKFMGMCRLPGPEYKVYRHMDIRFVPYHSLGTALLYFTGSFEYNTQMRASANKKGYMLNEYGLYKFTKDENNKKKRGPQVEEAFTTEESVCAWLGVPYLTPDKRNL